MADFTAALDREIEELEQELSRDPTYAKLKRLKEVRWLYSTTDNGRVVAVIEPKAPPKPRSPSPMRQRMLERAAEFLKGKTEPVRTAEIFEELSERGFAIGGNSPQNNLSAMLSNSPLFVSHGRMGWTLQTEDDAAEIAGMTLETLGLMPDQGQQDEEAI